MQIETVGWHSVIELTYMCMYGDTVWVIHTQWPIVLCWWSDYVLYNYSGTVYLTLCDLCCVLHSCSICVWTAVQSWGCPKLSLSPLQSQSPSMRSVCAPSLYLECEHNNYFFLLLRNVLYTYWLHTTTCIWDRHTCTCTNIHIHNYTVAYHVFIYMYV